MDKIYEYKWHRHYGVYGICINENNELMVIKKNGGPYTGLFDLPGGGMENPECLEESVKREFLEETGYNVCIDDVFGFYDFITKTPYNGFEYTHHIALMYYVKIISKESNKIEQIVINNDINDDNDSLGFEWINIQKLNAENSSPLVIRAIEHIRKSNNKNFNIIKFGINE